MDDLIKLFTNSFVFLVWKVYFGLNLFILHLIVEVVLSTEELGIEFQKLSSLVFIFNVSLFFFFFFLLTTGLLGQGHHRRDVQLVLSDVSCACSGYFLTTQLPFHPFFFHLKLSCLPGAPTFLLKPLGWLVMRPTSGYLDDQRAAAWLREHTLIVPSGPDLGEELWQHLVFCLHAIDLLPPCFSHIHSPPTTCPNETV